MTTFETVKSLICPACQNADLENLEYIDLKQQHHFYAPSKRSSQEHLTALAKKSAEAYRMERCVKCCLEFANPLTSPSNEWYEEAYRLLDLYPTNRWEFDYVVNRIRQYDLVGDIGCGSGMFLDHCEKKDIICHGLDFSTSAVLDCRERGLSADVINITEASLESSLKKSVRSVIFSAHTLEHLDDPQQLFSIAHQWSVEDSTLWISVPSDRRPSRFFNEVDILDQPPHHLTRWNSESMKVLGLSNGWCLEEIVYEPISLKTVVWHYATRLLLYRRFIKRFRSKLPFLERLLRYLVYPIALLQYAITPVKPTGFSMLAKYSKFNK